MTLPELIAALTAATEPSRALDGEIEMVLHPELREAPWNEGARNPDTGALFWHTSEGKIHKSPRYTSSIDAARTLVREGGFWQVGGSQKEGYMLAWSVWASAIHRLPAVALCIAALRDREGRMGCLRS